MSSYVNKLFVVCSCILALALCLPAYSQERLIFLHIPKSGGVTVSSLLMNEYTHSEIYNSDPKQIKLYAYGWHYSLFETSNRLNINDFYLITFLRHPVARVISEHKYCIGKHKGNAEILKAHRLPPYGDPLYTASNIACYMLSGLDMNNPLISIETRLAHAKDALTKNFDFIGITEKMEESIALLYSWMGWREPEDVPHFNATHNTETFSDELLAGIAERNWADIELYEFAQELYEKQKFRSPLHLPSSSESVQFFNKINYTFDQQLRGYGWGIRERTRDSAYLMRWVTEQNEAAIDFNLQPDKDYALNCFFFLQPTFCQQLSFKVNNISLPISPKYKGKGQQYTWIEYTATIPGHLIQKSKKTRLVFAMDLPKEKMSENKYKNVHYQSVMDNYLKGDFACRSISLK